MVATPTIDQFLGAIATFVRQKEGAQIQDYLRVEPPLPPIYYALGDEVRQNFPKGSSTGLEKKCEAALKQQGFVDSSAEPWPALNEFIKTYLEFFRDINFEDLVATHQLLTGLVNQCITAFSHATHGVILLPITTSLCSVLSKLAMTLDKRPDLIAHIASQMVDDESGGRQTLVESTAEVLQRGFTICLSDRSGGGSASIEGKKRGIYAIATLVLKLLFQCHKTRLASQLFTNISQHAPPLTHYPAAQRVSYLYYLGRYCFSSNHFYSAQVVLNAAYVQCHAQATKQRRLILIYLTATNIILGRFPSARLLSRPEAAHLGEIFLPICRAIAKGDLISFKAAFETPYKGWLLKRGLYLPLKNRCEVLVWRTLARRTFLLTGTAGEGAGKKAATFELSDLTVLAQALTERMKPAPTSSFQGGPPSNGVFTFGNQQLPQQQTGSAPGIPSDPDLSEEPDNAVYPSLAEVEAIVASIIDQGLIKGYISHRLLRVAIKRGRGEQAQRPDVQLGFPPVWPILKARAQPDTNTPPRVPGWVTETKPAPAFGAGFGGYTPGPGMVINLSGARPAGAPMTG